MRTATHILLAVGLLAAPLAAHAAWTGTDAEFVALVESNNYAYFRYNQGGPYHLFRGAGQHDELESFDPRATCAGDGFGMAALVVGAYRGWMSDETAYTNILALLRSYDTELARDGDNFFNHFYYFDSGLPDAEYSPIDSTWFICGALLAAQYFKGTEVDTIANRLYDAMNYNAAGPLYDAYFEYIIINIVGAGSRSNGWNAATALDAWERCSRASGGFMHGPLFWYQWPQAFVDFRFRTDSLGTNHFNIAMNAYLQQRQKCADLHNAEPLNYPDFGTNAWGLTSATASKGYLELRPFSGFCTANTNYGVDSIYCSPPSHDVTTDEDACDSGTLVPICLPACMTHTPYEAREAMKHIYNTYDAGYNVYDRYSFLNGLNTGAAKSGGQHIWDDNAAMDYGCNAVVIENFRSGVPWKYFMAHPCIVTGMLNCGFTTPADNYREDWNDGSDPNAWTGSTTFANSDGSDPTAAYETIPSNSVWVNGYARKLVANGSGDVVRFELKEADQSKKDLLSFWLRGASGGEQFDVGLRDAEGHEFRLNITNHVSGGTVSTNWTRVRIPLRSYAVSGNPNTDVRILFLGDFNVRFRAAGTIYVEDVAFVDDDWAPDPPTFGAACIDGRVTFRWGYPAADDVVGYNIWRRSNDVVGFEKINDVLISARHAEADPAVDSQWGEDCFYAIQCRDRRGNTGAFSANEYEQHVFVGRHRDLDWGDGQNPNTFGGYHGTWGNGVPGEDWRDIRFETRLGWDGHSNWVRVCEGNTNCGNYVELRGDDIGAYDAVTFWLKKNWGADQFDFGFKSTNFTERLVDIRRYLPDSTVPTNWTCVTIPLIDFTGVVFTAMDNLSITFRSPGSIFVDDIRFVRLEPDSDILLVLEGEKVAGHLGGSTNDTKSLASGGRVLGDSWATNSNDDAWWTICPSNELNEAYLDVRYACGAGVGRTLEAMVNSDIKGTLPIQPTGGWGDQTSHFREASVRLGRITLDCFLLKLRAPDVGSAVNLDRVVLRTGTRYFREAEDCDAQSGSSGTDSKAGASGGEVLGSSWGGANGNYAQFTNIVLSAPVSNAILRVRSGQDWGDGRLIRVKLDGTNVGQLAFARTHGWLFHYYQGGLSELPLGTVPAGTHTLRLEAEGADESVNLDWLRIDDATETKAFDTDADGIPDSQERLFGTSPTTADTDGDSLDDLYEISILGGYVTSPTNTDTDADTQTDREELIAGTDPTSAGSVFLFTTTVPQPGGSVRLTWPGAAGKSYEISYCDGSYTNATAFTPVTNPDETDYTNSTVTYVDDGTGTSPGPGDPSARQRTYRVRAYLP